MPYPVQGNQNNMRGALPGPAQRIDPRLLAFLQQLQRRGALAGVGTRNPPMGGLGGVSPGFVPNQNPGAVRHPYGLGMAVRG